MGGTCCTGSLDSLAPSCVYVRLDSLAPSCVRACAWSTPDTWAPLESSFALWRVRSPGLPSAAVTPERAWRVLSVWTPERRRAPSCDARALASVRRRCLRVLANPRRRPCADLRTPPCTSCEIGHTRTLLLVVLVPTRTFVPADRVINRRARTSVWITCCVCPQWRVQRRLNP